MSNLSFRIGSDQCGIVIATELEDWWTKKEAAESEPFPWCKITLRDDEFTCVSHDHVHWDQFYFLHNKLKECLNRESGRAFFGADFGNLAFEADFTESGKVIVKGSLRAYMGFAVCQFRLDLVPSDLAETLSDLWKIVRIKPV